MTEQWKDIQGYEGIYQVSSFGRVRSLDRHVEKRNGTTQFIRGQIKKPFIHRRGYIAIHLSKGDVVENAYVHRLVAEAFIPNPDNLPTVNHKDEDKTNNHVSNLEWCSYQYNLTYNDIHNRTKATMKKRVQQLTLDGKVVAEYESAMDAARKTGYAQSHISDVCRGEQKFAYGFIWKYINQDNGQT